MGGSHRTATWLPLEGAGRQWAWAFVAARTRTGTIAANFWLPAALGMPAIDGNFPGALGFAAIVISTKPGSSSMCMDCMCK